MLRYGTHSRSAVLSAAVATLLASGPAQAQATPAVQHVLLLSVDGLREADLTDPNTNQFLPDILGLQSLGVSYTNAQTVQPSNGLPGLLAYVTGGGPRTTGVFYDDSFARNLLPPGSSPGAPSGTEVLLTGAIDKNNSLLSGGGAFGVSAIDPANLPLTSGGQPVFPSQYLKVNTIFNVANSHGLPTAFSDDHPASSIVNGPSGKGVNDLFSPEIDAQTALLNKATGITIDGTTLPTHVDLSKFALVDPSTDPQGPNDPHLVSTISNYRNTEAYDALKVQAIVNEINGKNSLGTAIAPVPAIFGMDFQAVGVGETLLSNATGTGGIGPGGTVNAALADTLSVTDQAIKSIMDALKASGLDKSTLVVLTAKNGQSPRTGAATLVSDSTISSALSSAGIGLSLATQNDVSVLWLSNQSQMQAAIAVLQGLAAIHTEFGIDQVLPGTLFGNPTGDARTPDIVVKLKPGFDFVGNPNSTTHRADHGGLNPDDLNIPLILSSDGFDPSLFGANITSPVSLEQLAPTILEALGLDPSELDAVRMEGTQDLPGLQFTASVPEPTSLSLLAVGVFGVAMLRRRSAQRPLLRGQALSGAD